MNYNNNNNNKCKFETGCFFHRTAFLCVGKIITEGILRIKVKKNRKWRKKHHFVFRLKDLFRSHLIFDLFSLYIYFQPESMTLHLVIDLITTHKRKSARNEKEKNYSNKTKNWETQQKRCNDNNDDVDTKGWYYYDENTGKWKEEIEAKPNEKMMWNEREEQNKKIRTESFWLILFWAAAIAAIAVATNIKIKERKKKKINWNKKEKERRNVKMNEREWFCSPYELDQNNNNTNSSNKRAHPSSDHRFC